MRFDFFRRPRLSYRAFDQIPLERNEEVKPIWACIAIAASGALLAQEPHQYTPADIEQGGRLFGQNCTGCHGPDGNQIAGIDLGRLKLRRPMSDEEIIGIIRSGIPGTPMPSFPNLSEGQAGMIVGYLHSTATDNSSQAFVRGDAARGKEIFEGQGQCQRCHRIKGVGGRLGPDLTEIGSLRRAVQLQQSILDPDAEIAPANRPYRVVLKDGTTVTGTLLNEDTFTVQMRDTKENLRSFEKSDLKDYEFIDKSPMPSYRNRLSSQQVVDVVTYLTTLKGPPSAPGTRAARR